MFGMSDEATVAPRRGVLVSWPVATTPIHEVGKARVREYECAYCHKVDVWDETWEFYGSLNAIDGGLEGHTKEPEPIVITCSQPCKRAMNMDGKQA